MKRIIENIRSTDKNSLLIFVIAVVIIVLLTAINAVDSRYTAVLTHLIITILTGTIFIITYVIADNTGDNIFKVIGLSFCTISVLNAIMMFVSPGVELVGNLVHTPEEMMVRLRIFTNIYLSTVILLSFIYKWKINKLVAFGFNLAMLVLFSFFLLNPDNSILLYQPDKMYHLTIILFDVYIFIIYLINIYYVRKYRDKIEENAYKGLFFSMILFSVIQLFYMIIPSEFVYQQSFEYFDLSMFFNETTILAYLILCYSMLYSSLRNPLKALFYDVDEKRIQAEKERHLLEKIFDLSNDIVIRIDENDVITEYNSAAIANIEKKDLLGMDLEDVFRIKSRWQRVERAISSCRKSNQEKTIAIELDTLTDTKLYTLVVIPDFNKHSQDCIIYLRQISDVLTMSNLKYNNEDQLTNLKNKFCFIESIETMMINKVEGIAVICDINGLAVVNQAYGYKTGDGIIEKCSALIGRNSLINEAFHFNGGLFAFILHNKDIEILNQVISQLNTEISNRLFDFKGVSMSYGHALINTAASSGEIILTCEKNMNIEKTKDNHSNKSEALNLLTQTLREKTNETEEHSERVTKYSMMMCDKLKCDHDFKVKVSLLANLHDIGKIAIADNILNKPESLSATEYEEIKRHSEVGYRIASTVENLKPIASGILHHHERWDGKGYPKALKNEEIPLMSRIVAIADTYDAMTANRPYRTALNKEIAKLEIKKNSGKQFDPNLVSIFLKLV
ncbi:MAG: HD domain-containing protein [Clostridia bacterium]|nr:HD domain-containing protein [Clostridia bacterium]